MGDAVNKKLNNHTFTGDQRKAILVQLGQFKNLAEQPWAKLTGAEQYELNRAFDLLKPEEIQSAMDKATVKK